MRHSASKGYAMRMTSNAASSSGAAPLDLSPFSPSAAEDGDDGPGAIVENVSAEAPENYAEDDRLAARQAQPRDAGDEHTDRQTGASSAPLERAAGLELCTPQRRSACRSSPARMCPPPDRSGHPVDAVTLCCHGELSDSTSAWHSLRGELFEQFPMPPMGATAGSAAALQNPCPTPRCTRAGTTLNAGLLEETTSSDDGA